MRFLTVSLRPWHKYIQVYRYNWGKQNRMVLFPFKTATYQKKYVLKSKTIIKSRFRTVMKYIEMLYARHLTTAST